MMTGGEGGLSRLCAAVRAGQGSDRDVPVVLVL